jgi:hypothetical protein
MLSTTLITVREEWQGAWQSRGFRKRVIIGLFFAIVIMCLFPIFFQTIEKRSGIVLNDPLLKWLHPHNVSLIIFIVLWALSLLAVYRAARTPLIFLTFMWGWVLLSLFRMLTITLVPLDPPPGLIGLVDPISNFFYGEKFVTRDLFFSGHTSTVFLLYFCLPGRLDKKIALTATVIVAVLLLVQHVHYTMDILGAFVFAWIAYRITRSTLVRA